VDLAADRTLGSGVYWLRLAQGTRKAERKIAIVR
jgi:hypothetical protein